MAAVTKACLQWLLNSLKDLELEERAASYLLGRGWTDPMIEEFRVHTWESSRTPCPDPTWSRKYGLHGERFEGRIIFPEFAPSGEILGAEFRTPYEKDPYKVVGESTKWIPVFGGMPILLDRIWETRSVVLVEGRWDAAPLWRCFPRAPVLSCGTANVSKTQFTFLERWVEDVYVVFDNDDPGHKGCRSLQKKARGRFRVHSLCEYGRQKDDPGALWERGGSDLVLESFPLLSIF